MGDIADYYIERYPKYRDDYDPYECRASIQARNRRLEAQALTRANDRLAKALEMLKDTRKP